MSKLGSKIDVNAMYGDPAAGKKLLAVMHELDADWDQRYADGHFGAWFELRYGAPWEEIHPDLVWKYVAALYEAEFFAHTARHGRMCRFRRPPRDSGSLVSVFVCVGDAD